jgi:hypothetical protein
VGAAAGGAATAIMPTGGMGNPHFTSNPERIYAYSGRDGLASFRWDGTDLKTHLRVTGPLPTGAGGGLTLDAGLDAQAARMSGGRFARPLAVRDPAPYDVRANAAMPAHLDEGDGEMENNPTPPSAGLILISPRGDLALADGRHGLLRGHDPAGRRPRRP